MIFSLHAGGASPFFSRRLALLDRYLARRLRKAGFGGVLRLIAIRRRLRTRILRALWPRF